MTVPVITGGIYLVNDRAIKLPPEDKRNWHVTRRSFLVLSGGDTNAASDWPIIFGCPLSTATSFVSRFDVKLAAGEGNVNKKCWVRIPQAQPLTKADLQDHTGILTAARLEEVYARLLWYMGLTSFDAKDQDPPF
ncbi:type II toxin-antitoxin system PemK/MazF family toxin [Streptomyces sp. NPDC017556]|uniref:type II toxin-antitoxin system PemK/MazF family toxin n=1 Tax=Streptomyces sp. NPDC017556 TaxID=3365002 RepID=UPI003796C833